MIAPVILPLLVLLQGEAPSPSPTLSDAARRHLLADTLVPVTHVRDLPARVRDALQSLFKSDTLEIADPGAPFEATDDVSDPRLPSRRLDVAGCSRDHCLLQYERGGYAHRFYAVLIAVSEKQATVEWAGSTHGAAHDLAELKSVVLQGKAGGNPTAPYW